MEVAEGRGNSDPMRERSGPQKGARRSSEKVGAEERSERVGAVATGRDGSGWGSRTDKARRAAGLSHAAPHGIIIELSKHIHIP